MATTLCTVCNWRATTGICQTVCSLPIEFDKPLVHVTNRELLQAKTASGVYPRLPTGLLWTIRLRRPAHSVDLQSGACDPEFAQQTLHDLHLTLHPALLVKPFHGPPLGAGSEAEVDLHVQRPDLVQVLVGGAKSLEDRPLRALNVDFDMGGQWLPTSEVGVQGLVGPALQGFAARAQACTHWPISSLIAMRKGQVSILPRFAFASSAAGGIRRCAGHRR
mmetsp:Transcript_110201/g.351226  ORF Transcript_110201/g.351226 Transcript_110201/m.351226 type:complete len:220 (-) Transcript_110201:2789-3448(-)